MLSVLLAKKIFSLFIIIFLGVVLVKLKLLKSEDSKLLSVVCLYTIAPIVNINAFMIPKSTEVLQNMSLALAGGGLVLILLVLVSFPLRKVLKLTPVEQLSIPYTNNGNLMIPLVASLFGQEWMVYTLGYGFVQTFLIWTHGLSVISGGKSGKIWKKFLNVNIISLFVGGFLFYFQIQLPDVVMETVQSLSSLLGPLCMMTLGMIIGGVDMKKVVTRKGIWKTTFLRLILGPILALGILVFLHHISWSVHSYEVLTIIMMCAAAPTASNITQFAQIYGGDAEYACEINILTTLACIATIPLMIQIFGMLI